MQIKAQTERTCPKCNGTMKRFLGHWQCSTTRCQHKEPANDLPPILVALVPEEPDYSSQAVANPESLLLCPTCKRVLEQIEADATDPYCLYCDECDSCYNSALEKEPPAAPVQFNPRYIKNRCACVLTPVTEVPQDTPKFCPRCKRVLLQGTPGRNADPEPYWFCDRCDQYLTQEDFPPKENEPMRCKYCGSPLEYDVHVRDEYKMWCPGCNACFNEAGKPQPGQYIRLQIPYDDTPLDIPVNHVEQLEAVAAAAVGLFTRNGKDLVYMPGAGTRRKLTEAVTELLKTGWRSSQK